MESRSLFLDPSGRGNMALFLGAGGGSVSQGVRSVMKIEEIGSKRRPLFFSTVEEFYDEEFYDGQLPEKKRRLTSEQVNFLEKSFESENKLEPERKTQLAKKLGLQPRQVAVWFQNRRARWKTKQLERDYDQLKSSYDSLAADYNSVLKENDKLKAELLSLTEKLQPKEAAGEPTEHHKSDPLPADTPPCLELAVTVEDRLSTGSGVGSAVVDNDSPQQLLDSCDSYFPKDEFAGAAAVDAGVNSEEDDGSDGGVSYFSDVFAATEPPEPVGWFIWS